jgi:hypothetical protein
VLLLPEQRSRLVGQDLLLFRVVPYEEALLMAARSAVERGDDGDYEVAVVISQMAAEIASEQVMTAYLGRKQVPELAEALAGFVTSYSLANKRVLKLYNALTEDPVQQEPFWAAYKAHAKTRGAVVHRGERVDKAMAEASVEVGRAACRPPVLRDEATSARPGQLGAQCAAEALCRQ